MIGAVARASPPRPASAAARRLRTLCRGSPIFSITSPDDCLLDRELLSLRGWTPRLIEKYLPYGCQSARPEWLREHGLQQPPARRTRLRSFLELDDDDMADAAAEGSGARGGDADPAPFGWTPVPQQWHVHRVQLVECTEHFILDYTRSLRRRRLSCTRIGQFQSWRQLMAHAFRAYVDSLDGPELMELVHRMIDHRESIEGAAGMRFPAKGG